MEIARLARVSPEILDVQQKAGLSRDDMQASMAQLKALREKVNLGQPNIQMMAPQV